MIPTFKPFKKKAKFFMPHFPIFTGNLKSADASNVKYLLQKLGNPQDKLKNVIHVVGTNGKGSSCAYLKSILNASGFTTCVYTSPHLHASNERIDILGEQISDLDLFTSSEKVRFLCEEYKISLTIFESLTIVAILSFAKANADFCIFEAGMGGECDATNVFNEESIIGVLLTSISYDHTRFLGNDLNSIISHKLGVIKKNKPVVFHPFSGEVLYTVLEKIAQKGAIPKFFGRDYNFCKVEFEDGTLGLEFEGKNSIIVPLPPLLGEHQLYNLTAVLAFFEAINLNLKEEDIIQGILNTKWAGRLERVTEDDFISLLPENSEIWFDGAHNEGGAKVIASWLLSQSQELTNIVIIGKTRGTEVNKFILPFKDLVRYGFAIEGKGEIYPEFKSVLLTGFHNANIECFGVDSIKEALKKVALLHQKPVRILICGSLYLARDLSFESF